MPLLYYKNIVHDECQQFDCGNTLSGCARCCCCDLEIELLTAISQTLHSVDVDHQDKRLTSQLMQDCRLGHSASPAVTNLGTERHGHLPRFLQ
eukprot:6196787-Pleurochrysis_carterae.AAC.1